MSTRGLRWRWFLHRRKSPPFPLLGPIGSIAPTLHDQSAGAATCASCIRDTTLTTNTKLAASTTNPKISSVRGAPQRLATAPASNDPMGWTPMNIVAYTAISRLRSSSGTRFCTVVFVAAICEVAANPITNSSAADNQNIVDWENAIRQHDKPTDIAAIPRASPW